MTVGQIIVVAVTYAGVVMIALSSGPRPRP